MDPRSAQLERVRVGRRWLTASRQPATCTTQAEPTHHISLLLLALVTLTLILFMNTCTLVRCEGQEVDIARITSKASTRPEVEPKADKASNLNEKVHNEEEEKEEEDDDEKEGGLSAIKLDERIDSEAADDEIQEEALLSTRLPRQQFRVSLVPNARSRTGAFKLITIQRRRANSDSSGLKQPNKPNVLKRSPQNKVDTSADDEDAIKLLHPKSKTPPKILPAASTKKISSATLKKLLSQTLPSGMNGTSYPSANYKGPNFKLVFIQRAAKSPAANSSNPSIKRVTGNNQKQQQPSLAASVSKQLANSLLYTAASNLMNLNFTGSTLIPSLSSLAAFATSSGTAATATTATTSKQANTSYTRTDEPLASSSTTSSPQHSSRAPDRKEATNESAGKDQVIDSGNNNLSWSVTKTIRPSKSQSRNRTKRPRPSKIYNLPVKFVANGQPNGVMFQSIKQHFATIKRLQQQASSAGQESTSSKGRRRLGSKTSSSAGQTRPKGTNSRLIYLPLKYMSNARPTKLSDVITTMARSTKASHKSSASSKHNLS